jgi:protein-disulfide isomerase
MGNKYRIFIFLLLAAGLALSILSGTSLCNFSGCSENHQYRLHGLPFPAVGIGYFGAAGILALLGSPFPAALLAFDLLLAGAAGAEINMILHQKNVVHAWCPFCLGIAATTYLLAAGQLGRYFISFKEGFQMNLKSIGKPLMVVSALLLGFALTMTGIAKPAAADSKLNLYMGKQESRIEVYFFSDWFCPFCAKVDEAIEAVYPALSQKAKILFVDKIIHQESMNFVPYHLSFAVHEKGKYMQLRKALFAVAKKTKNPSYDDIKAAIDPLKVTYNQLSFLEVTQQMTAFQKLADQYKVVSTPTMIIRNTKTNKIKTLTGNAEIKPDLIMKAVKELE